MLTEKQHETAVFIQFFIDEHGYSPTFREIADNFEINISTAYARVQKLAQEGVIEHIPGSPRTIRFVREEGFVAESPLGLTAYDREQDRKRNIPEWKSTTRGDTFE